MSSLFEIEVDGGLRSWRGDPMDRLLDVLRALGLTAAKEGCGEGECGACTVLLDGAPVCSCLIPIFQAEASKITTAEGLFARGDLEELSACLVAEGGVQCGACTPGIALSAWALLEAEGDPDRETIREAIAGNLCRCTGYERIIASLLAAAHKRRESQG